MNSRFYVNRTVKLANVSNYPHEILIFPMLFINFFVYLNTYFNGIEKLAEEG